MNEREPQPNSPEQPAGAASACQHTATDPEPTGYRPLDTHGALSGQDLRYVLTSYITRGYGTVARMVKKLAADGYTVWGRASKVVSDALRWEIGRGRIQRVSRGIYATAGIPSSTYYRIRAHSRACFLAPHVVAERWERSRSNRSSPPPPADRYWREWRKSKALAG